LKAASKVGKRLFFWHDFLRSARREPIMPPGCVCGAAPVSAGGVVLVVLAVLDRLRWPQEMP